MHSSEDHGWIPLGLEEAFPTCSLNFFDSGSQKKRERIHSDEKPIKSFACGKCRGGGTGGAGGAIAPPTFVILLSNQPLAPPTFLVRSLYKSTTNFSYLPPPLDDVLLSEISSKRSWKKAAKSNMIFPLLFFRMMFAQEPVEMEHVI